MTTVTMTTITVTATNMTTTMTTNMTTDRTTNVATTTVTTTDMVTTTTVTEGLEPGNGALNAKNSQPPGVPSPFPPPPPSPPVAVPRLSQDEYIGFRGEFRNLPAPIDHINLHIRGGHVLVQQSPANTTAYSRKNPLSLIVALNDSQLAEGQLYWDDGVRIDAYEDGVYLLTSFTARQNTLEIKVLHRGYADPNNLKFTTVKTLGLATAVTQLTVLENGIEIPSAHSVSYNTTTQVLLTTQLALELGKDYTLQWS
ncbi:maltase-glucoamylase-like [Anser cygnoides]|uniref:maltase-glucoamylase-like n=1 Tax=Anser cygnoides TaxID=8845 RepID=UPI0034D16629